MHTSVSGLVMLFNLTQVAMPSDMMNLQRFALRRSMRSNMRTLMPSGQNRDEDNDDDDALPPVKRFRPH